MWLCPSWCHVQKGYLDFEDGCCSQLASLETGFQTLFLFHLVNTNLQCDSVGTRILKYWCELGGVTKNLVTEAEDQGKYMASLANRWNPASDDTPHNPDLPSNYIKLESLFFNIGNSFTIFSTNTQTNKQTVKSTVRWGVEPENLSSVSGYERLGGVFLLSGWPWELFYLKSSTDQNQHGSVFSLCPYYLSTAGNQTPGSYPCKMSTLPLNCSHFILYFTLWESWWWR